MKNGLLILLTGALLAACAPDPKNNTQTGANGDVQTTGTSTTATEAPTDLSAGEGRNADAQGGVVASSGGTASSAQEPSGSGEAAGEGGGAANPSVSTGPNTVAPGTETQGTTTGAPSTGTEPGGVTDSGTTDPAVISDDRAADAPSNTVTDNSNTSGNPNGSGAGASGTGTTDSTAATPAGEASSLRGRITEFNAQDRTFSISGNDQTYRVSVTDATAYSGGVDDAEAFFGTARSERNVTVQGRIEGETITATAVTLN